MRSSSAITMPASSTSWCLSASSARVSVATIMSSAPSACVSSLWSSSWNACRVSGIGLAELPGDVVLGALVVRGREDLLGRPDLDELAEPEEPGAVGDAGGLLHVVGDDDDGELALELVD